ncbi:putative toxin-antitoxin system, toxin component [Aeromicrobium marinum DSM 15272]|uniref:Toxin-antitoxin system, toxin component n=1 Tax=Aeromicrobium marinum DSM 15272 TaxID=585531 RepID=E2SBW8_9ACTN|nr:SRPBCC domain-containing protein [Aeromicrobium marinum]EFQ83254.1 putative toxin-antitoxin system, toxin component [Aeromicrobium marinum DSM 15272]
MTTTPERSETPHTFVLERTFPVTVDRLWRALTVDEERAAWFGSEENFDADEVSHDFRVGGRTVDDGRWHDGPRSRYVATYTDIVDLVRIVISYDMWIDGVHISTSTQCLRLDPVDGGVRLTQTEQGLHLDDPEGGAMRETGFGSILDALASHLESSPS